MIQYPDQPELITVVFLSSFLIFIILDFYLARSLAHFALDPGGVYKAAIKPAGVGARHIDLDAAIPATLWAFHQFHHLIFSHLNPKKILCMKR